MKKLNLFLSVILLALAFQTQAQITVSEYTRAMKVDAYNVPAPDVTFTSNCSENIKVDITEKMASGGCLGNLIRTYTATDDCGNTATAEQYLSLQDNKGPEIIGVPADLVLDSENDLGNEPVVSAIDLGNQTIKVTLSISREENKLIRTWSATDKCGNESQAVQTITFKEINAKG